MKLLVFLLGLFALGGVDNSTAEESSDDQLWIMIKTDSYFRGEKHLQIVNEVTELIEKRNLGALDGHSSGVYQFEFNFYEVTKFKEAKATVKKYLDSNYSNLTYTISNDYEMPYEKL